MKRIIAIVIILLIAFTFIGCQKDDPKNKNPINLTWPEIVENSKGTSVNFYYWGGSTAINTYFDNFVAPNLKEKYDITFNILPVSDIKDIVNKILSEKQNNQNNGSVDILWINGENFKLMKDEHLLYGDLTSILPNFEKYIKENPWECNEETNGLEVPFGKAQFVVV